MEAFFDHWRSALGVRSTLAVVAFSLLATACATKEAQLTDPPEVPGLPQRSTHAEFVTPSGIRILALHTGWVGVRPTHRELRAPRFLAVPLIFAESSWADWMPIISYVVIHPEGTFLVDTGASPDINDKSYFSCDEYNEVFYDNNLRFAVPNGDDLNARLTEVGIAPADIMAVVISHFHADHIGEVALLPNARFFTGAGNWPKHVGSFTCRLPSGFTPEFPEFSGGTFGGFRTSKPFTSDGKIKMIALPGHTPGHIGLMVSDADKTWLMVGDATFDADQTKRSAVTGVSQDFDDAIATQESLKNLLDSHVVILLPSHDAAVLSLKTKSN